MAADAVLQFIDTNVLVYAHDTSAGSKHQKSRDLIEELWRNDVNRVTMSLIEDGKRQGYIDKQLSEQDITFYLEILRRGIFASPDLISTMDTNAEAYRKLNYLFVYGLIGERA